MLVKYSRRDDLKRLRYKSEDPEKERGLFT
jgi:hypothetical protein